MRILFIHQYFRVPEEGGGIRSYYMCQALVNEGHEVIVISAHNEKKYSFKEIEGIKVHYLPVFYENRLRFFGRIYAFLKFLFTAIVKALKIPNIDVVYTSSSPLTVGIIGIVLKRVKNIPFIFEVMDLWPEAPIQMGFIKNPLLKSFLYKLEKTIYKHANIVVAASPGMENGIKKVSPNTPTIMIPNMSDCDFFKPLPKNLDLSRKYGIEDKFVCCYTGAIGLSNHLENLLEVAVFLKSNNIQYIHFLIAGTGASLPKLMQEATDKHLNNISFLGNLPKIEIREVLNVSDINLIFFGKEKILETNSPNKFFDGLAAGLTTIINVNGWIKELCEKYNCGKYWNRESPEDFFKLITAFRQNPALLNTYSRNARKLAETRFNKEIVLKDFIKLFEKI
ncbi:MAG TPA: glycosyltransferase family 4 protein [Cytophagales bacterium]|nr:glycosyltransferase family 4 protein [Cytophagales bacterium]